MKYFHLATENMRFAIVYDNGYALLLVQPQYYWYNSNNKCCQIQVTFVYPTCVFLIEKHTNTINHLTRCEIYSIPNIREVVTVYDNGYALLLIYPEF